MKIVESGKKTTPRSILKNVTQIERKHSREIKNLKKKVNGPKVSDRMSTVVTLGVLTGNKNSSLSRQMRAFLSPILLKSQTTGSTTSPLSIRACQYSLWRITRCEVHFMPLVGRANVGGSVLFAALDQDATSSQPESPDSIKAKYHTELTIGTRHKWVIPWRYLRGPRSGWWGMDTGESPTDTIGCAIDFWILYATVNTLQTSSTQQAYDKPIFSVEVRVTYEFSGYEPKTALSQLTNDNVNTQGTVKLKNAPDGALVMQVDNALARILNEERPHKLNAQTSGVGEKLWAIATAAVEGAAAAAGPWGWLLRGGFWLIKKFFGVAGSNATDVYMVYSSIEDADKDNRIFQQVSETQLTNGPVRVTQISTPNVNTLGTGNYVGAVDTAYLPTSQAPVQPTPGPIYFEGVPQVTVTANSIYMAAVIKFDSEQRWNGRGAAWQAQDQQWALLVGMEHSSNRGLSNGTTPMMANGGMC